MKELSKKQMLSVKAEGLSAGAIAAIGAGVAFVIGIIDGFVRPFKCR